MSNKDIKNRLHLSRRNLLKFAAVGALGVLAGPALLAKTPAHAATIAQGDKKSLIVFYSRSGNTRDMAKLIQAQVGGDMLELETLVAYPNEYRTLTEQAKKELESGHLPALKNTIEGLDRYSVIYLGSPNWWSTIAMPVRTFLTQYDLSGKTIVPFITHEGTGLGKSIDDIKMLSPNATVAKGLAVRGGRAKDSQKEVAEWLRGLGLVP